MAARRLVREHGLPMKVIGVDYVDSAPAGVHASSTSAPRTGSTSARWSATWPAGCAAGWSCGRSGPRDEARLQGGIGPCGRDLCCATFLKDFEPVSVRMAKDQDLPVNPLRIAGACGRLMCCLKYEHPLYQDFHEKAPEGRRAGRDPGGAGHGGRAQRAGGQGRGEADRRTAGSAPARGPASAGRGRPTRRRYGDGRSPAPAAASGERGMAGRGEPPGAGRVRVRCGPACASAVAAALLAGCCAALLGRCPAARHGRRVAVRRRPARPAPPPAPAAPPPRLAGYYAQKLRWRPVRQRLPVRAAAGPVRLPAARRGAGSRCR